MYTHASFSRAVCGLLVLAVCLGGVSTASAGVRAFVAATGAEDSAFVTLSSTGRPDAVIPDGKRGVFVVGRLEVGHSARRIVHILPSGKVDPAFSASLAAGMVYSGAARGNELALLGSFTTIDGSRRRNIAVLDATTGRLSSWTPDLPTGVRGEGYPRVVFTASRLVASSIGSIAAWKDGASQPTWRDSFPTGGDGGIPEIALLHGRIMASGPGLVSIDPRDGRTTVADKDFGWDFQSIGGRLVYTVDGDYDFYDTHSTPTCGQAGNTSPTALTGDAATLYVAVAPVDADSPAPPTTIVACTRADSELKGFAPPSLPMPGQFVWAMAMVGDHLLVFTSTF